MRRVRVAPTVRHANLAARAEAGVAGETIGMARGDRLEYAGQCMHEPPVPRRVADLDWSTWVADDVATLVFVVQGDRVLLIEKKRGLGAGKVNGPGGRIEPGETPRQCAARELFEELCVRAGALTEHGELSFQFTDGYALHCHVFRTEDVLGEAMETEEAVPLWTPRSAIPWERMWADDALWLPTVLAGGSVRGRFVFEGDAMLDAVLETTKGDGSKRA